MTTLALKLTTAARTTPAQVLPVARRASLRRMIAHRWDLVGVLALMGWSSAYAVYALLHLAS